MKPLRTELTNFGVVAHAVIDYTGIDLAAVAGPNGAGKSTSYAYAPMFALFGTTKPGTSMDDMVRTGASEMSVAHDFEHHGSIWRAIRTRSTKGKGKSTLELQQKSGELWESKSGASMDETQKKIVDLLNWDEELAIATSCIMQGDANNFTSRRAGERKAIFAQLLQLEQYDDLKEKAKAKVAATTISLERDKATLTDIDLRLEQQPIIANGYLEANNLLSHLINQESVNELDIEQARVDLANVTRRTEEAERYRKQFVELTSEVSGKEEQLQLHRDRYQKAVSFLATEEQILAGSAEHETITQKVAVLKERETQRAKLTTDGVQTRKEFNDVTASLSNVEMEIRRQTEALADRVTLEQSVAKLKALRPELEAMNLIKKNDEDLFKQIEALEATRGESVRSYEAYKLSQEMVISVHRGKAAMLNDAQCIDIEKAECRFLADAKEARKKVEQLEQDLEQWLFDREQEMAVTQTEIEIAHKEREALKFSLITWSDLQQQITNLVPSENKLASLDGKTELLATLKTQRTDLFNRRVDLEKRLSDQQDEYKKLTAEIQDLAALQDKLIELGPWVRSKEQLPAMRETKEIAQENIDRLGNEIGLLRDKLKLADDAYKDRYDPSGKLLEEAKQKVATMQLLLTTIRDQKNQVSIQLGSLQSKLDGLKQDAQMREEIRSRIEPLAKELTRWQTLVKAFGKDGIPALIIENTVPELERIANDILGQMSGGKHTIRFETQRELKSRSGMAETLDIIVGDWAGERIYETFSGGEQLRIDFAIRFALAELLARRAGNKIEWLVIDEGFGSQSDEYLPMVIDAVKSVAHRFGVVIVISHVKAVQEAFEQKIIFQPAGDETVEVKVA